MSQSQHQLLRQVRKIILDDFLTHQLVRSTMLESTEEIIEFRSGRKIFFRNITLRKDSKNNDKNCDDQEKIGDFLFVHGSCAASSQYDSLLRSMADGMEGDDGIIDGGRIECYLFDAFGFGKSKEYNASSDWNSFSESELAEDLKQITLSILEKNDFSGKLYIVAHSYGPSQVIKLINSLKEQHNLDSKINGVVFLSGGLKDGPGSLTKDGGHWIWRYMPMYLLRKLQPSLDKEFIKAAIHPKNRGKLRESALQICSSNDMATCKAFYRQQRYASSKDAEKVKVSVQLIFDEYII